MNCYGFIVFLYIFLFVTSSYLPPKRKSVYNDWLFLQNKKCNNNKVKVRVSKERDGLLLETAGQEFSGSCEFTTSLDVKHI
jgi:hypothetical protein